MVFGMRGNLSLLILAILLSGCILTSGCEFKAGMTKAPVAIGAVDSAVGLAEPVVDALEDVVGPVVPVEIAEKGENVAGKVGTGLQVAGGLARIIPGGQAYAGVLDALGLLAIGVSGFFARRLVKSQAALKTMIKVADNLGGTKIKAVAAIDGTTVEIEKAYLDTKKQS